MREAVGSCRIEKEPETLSAHTVDGVMPRAVLFPENVDQISEAVKLASREKLTIVPWGGGSKMGMGHPPSQLDLVVSLARLNGIVDMDAANLTVTVQSGVRFKDVQTALAAEEDRCYLPVENDGMASDQPICSDRDYKGSFIPLMPFHSQSATLGGIISTDSSGPTRLLYGSPRDMVLGVRYVAPNGGIVGVGGKTVKNVSGYDMSKLMIGSHGSLGILCEITLRLLPLPERMGTLLSSFSTMERASLFIDRIFETSMLPASVELLNSDAYSMIADEKSSGLNPDNYVVAVGLEGFEEDVSRMARDMRQIATEAGVSGEVYHEDDAHRTFWYTYSNVASQLSDRSRDMISIKLNYPISRYPHIVEKSESLISENRLKPVFLTHAGSGITWIHLMVASRDGNVTDRVVTVIEKLLEHSRELGGNLVIERAYTDVKERCPVWGAPREDIAVMQRIKREMDPLNIFCPGRFVGGI